MSTERTVKLFRNGRNQAVRIPREFELPGEDAVMRRDGDRLIIEPATAAGANARLAAILAALDPHPPEDDYPSVQDNPPGPVDL